MTNTPISGLSLGGAIAATDAFAGVEVVGVGPVRKLGEQFQELALDFVAGACLGSGSKIHQRRRRRGGRRAPRCGW